MPIKTVNASQIECQDCPATILVMYWQDANKYGWTCPSDGHLQLCPACTEIRKQVMFATAVPPGTPETQSYVQAVDALSKTLREKQQFQNGLTKVLKSIQELLEETE